MTHEEQLQEWLKGNAIHDKEQNRCCPDFSCCNGELAPLEVRERFVKAYHEDDQSTMMQMLVMFLGNMLQKKDVEVCFSGGVVPDPSKLN